MPTILVVDDEPGIRMLISQILEQNGFTVLTAQDGADAVSVSHSHPGEIGLVITDVPVSRSCSPTFVRAMSAEDAAIPVLFMSSYYDPSMLDQLDASLFLAKPFTIERLLDAVRAMLPDLCPEMIN